ncbi:hypothetical protein GCM10010842_09960 [Deinococcus daejeonensis]|uniref:Uncharacterized protein n=2 Tax=Deinococcus daejeonensis TaxID=1007098 RepID=A0ABQ2IZP1_9DEIO|nr:hypothetical protein GCM10010842_09960 [Deinococcus daejeonensis]
MVQVSPESLGLPSGALLAWLDALAAGWQADGTLALTPLLIEDGAHWEVRWPAPDAPLTVGLCAPHYGEGHTLSARRSTLSA